MTSVTSQDMEVRVEYSWKFLFIRFGEYGR